MGISAQPEVGRTVLSLSLSVPMVAPSPEVMNAVSSSLVAAATVSRPPSVAPMVSVLSTASLEEQRVCARARRP